ncbi:hypothetical protein EV426DRAFT_703734 [Tirmania nivea]|nr:hypothetical protein EV426DRAFT_703734 [Tirmania nivea]
MPAEMTMGREMSNGIRKRKRKELELYKLPENKNIRVQEQLENKREDVISIPSDSEYKDVGNGTLDDEALESDKVVLYKLDYQMKEEVEKKVNWLLHGDRFVCQEEQRETYGHRFRASEIVTAIYELFFQWQKMRGNRDPTFFDKINSVFICLVASALQYCLKKWKTGEHTKVLVNYKLRNTWALYDEKVGKLILVNIKADLRTRIGGFDKKTEVELSKPCAVVENGLYLDELQQELQMTMET